MKTFTEDEVKHLLFYGKPSRDSELSIDDEDWVIDWALSMMFQLLETETIFNRAEVERTFWKRIGALANTNLHP